MTSHAAIDRLTDRPDFTVRRTIVSTMDNAVYLLTARASGAQILIDAADDLPALESLLASGSADSASATRLVAIVTTHSHWDHTRALAGLAQSHPAARVVVGAADAPAVFAERGVSADTLAKDGDVLVEDGLHLEVIGLRGHTPGSIALATTGAAPTLLFTGDSLFPGGVGNTQHDAARFNQLFADVTERIFARFPDDTVVYPGHGQPTTLGAERPHLSQWRERGW